MRPGPSLARKRWRRPRCRPGDAWFEAFFVAAVARHLEHRSRAIAVGRDAHRVGAVARGIVDEVRCELSDEERAADDRGGREVELDVDAPWRRRAKPHIGLRLDDLRKVALVV